MTWSFRIFERKHHIPEAVYELRVFENQISPHLCDLFSGIPESRPEPKVPDAQVDESIVLGDPQRAFDTFSHVILLGLERVFSVCTVQLGTLDWAYRNDWQDLW